MFTGILRSLCALYFLILFAPASRAGCIDSVHIKVQPVQCFGLRNGGIEVTEVFGGISPFYFSLDGQSFSTRPVIDLLWAGEYILYVRDSTGCVEKYPVLVPEPEELRVKLSIADTSVLAGEWVQVKATVYPPGSTLSAVSWRPPALFANPQQLTQLIRIVEDTDIAIEVRNASGCIARDNLPVVVEQTNLYFPNAFAPGSNQDNYFTLFAGEGVAQIVRLQVFNRNGNLVFEKQNFLPNDPLKGWNGRWRGQAAPPGVYPWVALVEFLDGKQQRFSGSVTLVGG